MTVALPRILLIIPGLLAGLLIPAVGATTKTPPASAVGMISGDFSTQVRTIHPGESLTLVNDSRFVHVIGPGHGGHVVSPAAGVPVLGFHLMPTNGVYPTGPWKTPGTYYLTCSVHPRMTLKVLVTG